ncbi:MAG: UDP-N-acetylglucosamine 2-epimerase (non-hydrolyzing) [Burkholderiaceae bacterium]|nr:UDP-N-acetylglucosamine 2-epimerase (non-hydrolyzing) [Burkholderiaceae bacterium]
MPNPIVMCMGTRPEIIKMAPVYRALREASLPVALLHTGQHEEMAWPLYAFFGMRPERAIALERKSDALAHLNAQLLSEIHTAFESLKPSAVLVHGDTSSALAAAQAAFFLKLPVGHVEAGLRSHDAFDPFPEEMNRTLIGRLARWHFAPTPVAVENLSREGVAADRIHLVGNSIVDATALAVDHLAGLPDGGLGLLPASLAGLDQAITGRRLLLVTAHRRENWGDGIASIAKAVARLLEEDPGFVAVWPVHANPRVRDTVARVMQSLSAAARARLFVCEPLNYAPLMWVMQRSWVILTDSGGIQEEALSQRVPVMVLRDTTERPEVLEAGAGLLVGTDSDKICAAVTALVEQPAMHQRMRSTRNPFGDGTTSRQIAGILAPTLHQTRLAA